MSESEEKPWTAPRWTEEESAARHARAEKGDPDAQRALGCAYWWGDAAPKDDVKSRYWYTLAAEQGHCEAMWDVATMYLADEGGPADVPRALEYMRRAASKRRWEPWAETAADMLIEIYQKGHYGIAPDAELAKHWAHILRDQRRKYRGWRRRIGRRRH